MAVPPPGGCSAPYLPGVSMRAFPFRRPFRSTDVPFPLRVPLPLRLSCRFHSVCRTRIAGHDALANSAPYLPDASMWSSLPRPLSLKSAVFPLRASLPMRLCRRFPTQCRPRPHSRTCPGDTTRFACPAFPCGPSLFAARSPQRTYRLSPAHASLPMHFPRRFPVWPCPPRRI